MTTLGARAIEFAKQYVVLVEALQGQGVPEKVAREEARITTLILLFEEENEEGQCPVCGHESGS